MDRLIDITTEEATDRAKKFIKETGILIGISSGANILASERWIMQNRPTGIVVTMLCDRGERYLSIFNK
jgi:cysteine synthase